MKRILNHTRHWLKAKGRHGTHSPFVYAFVEQVLRSARNRTAPEEATPAFSAKETGLLVRTFRYLDKKVVYASASLLPFARWLAEAAGTNVVVKSLEPGTDIPETDVLLFCECNAMALIYLKQAPAGQTLTVVLPLIHRDVTSEVYWQEAAVLENFKMVMDAWYFGLLSNHPDFKMKQFFRLR